jgi:DNA-binding protein YbaB
MTSPFARNLTARIAAIQEEIDTEIFRTNGGTVEGSTSDASVRVLFNDDDSTAVTIDPVLVDPNGVTRLEHLVAEAIDDGARRLEELRTARISAAIRAMLGDLFVVPSGSDES